MANPSWADEFVTAWCPVIPDAALNRLRDLLRHASPLLVHGRFTAEPPRGCLATHIGWNHPQTQDWQEDAGIRWLTKVAKLNPATSAVILAWDQHGIADWNLRAELLQLCDAEAARRAATHQGESDAGTNS
ncbi:hypothetical protein [Tuwongella immobilis]|uniref:Uncharacterized protein n=1 Tax=Tuwongella immobilis TaxID=692036 RepID=A0A6C2YJF2_9BACT|nr:hypothetical protein [Tuwongella immobilis]VIP01497.1 unnamed protein product [Tuwongella immobilis]VTR98583.1 unnamed protein product [Tuwongella immobilis]